MASKTEELNSQSNLILIHLNLQTHVPLATMLGSVVLKLSLLPRKYKNVSPFPQRHEVSRAVEVAGEGERRIIKGTN